MGNEISETMPNTSHISLNLESLLKLSNSLNSSTDVNYILNSALLSLMGKLRMIRAGIYQPNSSDSNLFEITIHKGKIQNSNFRISSDLQLSDIDSSIISENSDGEIINSERRNCTNQIPELCENGYEYAFPLIINEKLAGLVCLGNRINSVPLSEDEMQYARLVCWIASAAWNNAENIINLKQASTDLVQQNQLLSSIFEMSRDFSVLLSRVQIIRILSYRLMGQLMVSKFSVYLCDEKGNFSPEINRFDTELSQSTLEEIYQIEHSILLKNFNFSHSAYQEINKIKIKVFVPMIVQGKKKGFLFVGKKLNGADFTDDNLRFMEALANNAMSALENDRLFKEELEKKKLESELNLALEIQQNLLPMDTPELGSGYSIAGESIPSRMVGGDYFDYIPLSDGRLMVAIGDVSGKGMPAALLMANVQAALRALAPLSLTLKDLVLRINSIVYKNTTPDKFVTFFVGILHSENHYFTYINAGHNPPMLLRQNGTQELLSEGGLILGIFDDGIEYNEASVNISSGDTLCLYTDGITEAPNSNGEEYGEDKLSQCLADMQSEDATATLREILNQVSKHSENENQYDDLTCVVIKRESEG